jgi:hypothetical protein
LRKKNSSIECTYILYPLMLKPYLVGATSVRVIPESGVVGSKSLSALGPSDESHSPCVFAWSM